MIQLQKEGYSHAGADGYHRPVAPNMWDFTVNT